MSLSVSILGLGLMGTGMAGRLLEHGYSVTVWNRTPGKADGLAKRGATLAPTPRAAVTSAKIVISMLADDDAARAVWQGVDGALSGVAPETVLIESSTVTVDWVHELHEAARQRGCQLLDAPVTGSKPQAAAGQLVFLVGGSEKVLDEIRPVLAAMSRDIVHLGPSGSGATMKLINNFVCGVQAVAIAEGIAAIEKSGLNISKAAEVLTCGAPGSPMVKAAAGRMLARDYTPNFMMRLMAKDLRYAIKQLGTAVDLEMVTAALDRLDRGIQAGLGDRDFSAIIELLRVDSGGLK